MGSRPCRLNTITNNYSVNPNYRPAMAQQWNALIQYTLGRSYVFQISYFGTRGTDLDVLFGPNRATPGDAKTEASRIPIQNALANIQYDQSIGTSINHTGAAQVTRRLAKGFGSSVTYTVAKTLSDSSILGSGVVQIENDYQAERAIVAAPLQDLAVTFNYQSLATNQKSNFYWNLVRGWQLNGTYDVNSGTQSTATVSGDPSGTGIIGSGACRCHGRGCDWRKLRDVHLLQYRGLWPGGSGHLWHSGARYDSRYRELQHQSVGHAFLQDR